jgi:glutathione S-transferase
MVENQLYWVAVHARWLIPENFAHGPAHFFDGAPEQVRAQALEEVRAAVKAVGVGRHTEPEIVALGVRSLAALSVMLGDGAYLMGDRPCGADATVFGVLAAILSPWFDSELRDRALGFGNLVAYVDRMMAEFHPEFPWKLQERVAAAA